MTLSWTHRQLRPNIIKELKSGVLLPLMDRIKEDNTLDIELRGNERAVQVYYRGGNLVKIKEKRDCFEVFFDERYFNSPLGQSLKQQATCPGRVKRVEDCQSLVAAFPFMKEAMDIHFTINHGDEREYQQLVVKENNFSSLSVSTDYFLCDMEYTNDLISKTESRTRLDLVGAHWPGNKVTRKQAASARLVIFEMKWCYRI